MAHGPWERTTPQSTQPTHSAFSLPLLLLLLLCPLLLSLPLSVRRARLPLIRFVAAILARRLNSPRSSLAQPTFLSGDTCQSRESRYITLALPCVRRLCPAALGPDPP